MVNTSAFPDTVPATHPAHGTSAARPLTGGCQCGAVRFAAQAAPLFTALCHCTMCRRAHAAPAVAWAMFDSAQVRFTQGEPRWHASSPTARRGFCGACGTPLAFVADFLPGLIDLPTGSFDEPERLPPQLHYWCARQLPWLKLEDGLPRHDGLPPMG